VVADDVILLGGRGEGGGGGQGGGDYERSSDRPVSMPRSAQQRPQPAASAAPPDDFSQGVNDDDVPF